MTSGNGVSFKISEFLTKPVSGIIGILKERTNQTFAWENQIHHLQQALVGKEGYIFFEFTIPGMSKIVDVVLLIEDKIFVIEYKNGSVVYNNQDIEQTLGYALRMKYFHSNSHDKVIVPILIATNAPSGKGQNRMYLRDDNVYEIALCNYDEFKSILNSYCNDTCSPIQDWQTNWKKGTFKSSPSIIAAAKKVWNNQHVRGLSTDLSTNVKSKIEHIAAQETIAGIIANAKKYKRKALVFLTGVPGAGKTLVGLNVSVAFQNEGASLLSGNDPLVKVLSTALRRNLDIHIKDLKPEERQMLNVSNSKKLDELKNKIAVDSIIRSVYGYKHEIIERLDYSSPQFPIKNGSVRSSQHIIIYDEAQRAWSVEKMRNGGRTKKVWQTKDWRFSEPALLLWDINKLDWGVFICLVGGGQEINSGESGINEWLRTIVEDTDKIDLSNWDVYMSANLTSKEYLIPDINNNTIVDYLNKIKFANPSLIHFESTLHLTECQRSPIASEFSDFINKLVDGIATQNDYAPLRKRYPIYITRNIETARKYLRKRQKELKALKNGAELYEEELVRTGMLMSSSARRLRPLGFDMKKVADYLSKTASWFLDSRENNIESSDFLEVALNEFFVQGLEIDLSCVIWDADFRYFPAQNNEQHGYWHFFKFNKNKWTEQRIKPIIGRTIESRTRKQEENQKINITQTYMRNAYRVLLTRARLGMVICVPTGTTEDPTRMPEFYQSTYDYLKSIGLIDLDTNNCLNSDAYTS